MSEFELSLSESIALLRLRLYLGSARLGSSSLVSSPLGSARLRLDPLRSNPIRSHQIQSNPIKSDPITTRLKRQAPTPRQAKPANPIQSNPSPPHSIHCIPFLQSSQPVSQSVRLSLHPINPPPRSANKPAPCTLNRPTKRGRCFAPRRIRIRSRNRRDTQTLTPPASSVSVSE